MTRLQRARRIANCPCITGGRPPYPDHPALKWTVRWEHWNPSGDGHLIAASLILDGMAAR